MPQRFVGVKQIQRLDDLAINRYGVPSLVLMENAGRAVADQVLRKLKGRQKPCVTVVCGMGNNAGDGFVVSRQLLTAGIGVNTLLIGKADKLKKDAAINCRVLTKLGYQVKEFRKLNSRILAELKTADVVVDAVFGAGLNRDVDEPFKSVIEAINKHAKYTLSVDIPSGLDGTTGKIYGVCVKAKKTVTFTCAKKGFFKGEGRKHTGRIIVVDIGIPLAVKKKVLGTRVKGPGSRKFP